MRDSVRRWSQVTRRGARSLWRTLRDVEHREVHELHIWLEDTRNLTRLSVLVFVPLLIAVVTLLSKELTTVSFLLFPPLASGTYTLFADPEGPYASPMRFVGGLTAGALSGWLALEISVNFVYHVAPGQFEVHAGAAALGIVLTGVVTWALDIELPTAFSTALLVLITGTSQLAYVLGVMLSSGLVAGVFVVWRDRFYEERSRYLYQTTQADDHVLVPMRGDTAEETALFGARLAAAHDVSKVVLLDLVEDADVAAAHRAALGGEYTAEATPTRVAADARSEAEAQAASEAAVSLEAQAERVESRVGVPCEVLVAVADVDPARTALDAADAANCDLVVTPYERDDGVVSPFVRGLFDGDRDVVVFHSVTGTEQWTRVMVPVRGTSDLAHAMLDYAQRLAGGVGSLSVCTCIDRESDRRAAESMLATLVETVEVACETRVSNSPFTAFLERNDGHYDLVVLGASTPRRLAARFRSSRSFEYAKQAETDVAIVHLD